MAAASPTQSYPRARRTTIVSQDYDGVPAESMAILKKRNITIHLTMGDVEEDKGGEVDSAPTQPTPPQKLQEEPIHKPVEDEKPRLKLLDMVLRQKSDKVNGLTLKKTLPVRLEAQARVAQNTKSWSTHNTGRRTSSDASSATPKSQPEGEKIEAEEAEKDNRKEHAQQGHGSVEDVKVPQTRRRSSTKSELNLPQTRKRVGFSCHERAILEAGISVRAFRSLTVRQLIPSEKHERKPSKREQTQKAAVDYLRNQSRLQRTPIVGDDAAHDDYSAPPGQELPTAPFVRYLRYVRAHPDAYRQMRSQQMKGRVKDTEYQHRLVALGEALSRVYGDLGETESLVVQAAYELGCWHQPDAWAKIVNTSEGRPKKAPVVNMLDIITKPPQLRVKVSIPTFNQQRIISPSKPETPKRQSSKLDKNSPEYQLREMRRLRAELETLIRGLSTMDFIRSREMALRMMEEGDGSIRKWWVSQKFCRYLRKRHREGTADGWYSVQLRYDNILC